MNQHPSLMGPGQQRVVDTGPTQRRVEDAGPTQPRVDPALVADALGAEPVGPPGTYAAITFAAVRARVAALVAARGQNPGPRVPVDVGPALRASLDELTAELRADGTTATPSEVAQVLLEMSIELSKKDRSALVAKLRERAAKSAGQSS
ncbi:MAG TPA: hypothetical protein VKE40_11550 [Gemmataceae bacterium]|nr:hypothetical protein [Gemmataceae bacterium]